MKSLLLACLLLTQAATAQMYADFTIDDPANETPLKFTVRLFYDSNIAPRSVANFIGLATGSRKWIDEGTGETKKDTPFYNGKLIHKLTAQTVVPPYASGISFGSPTGSGRDGPGYYFQREANNIYHGKNIMYMESSAPSTLTSSVPTSSGSRIFISSNLNFSYSDNLVAMGEVLQFTPAAPFEPIQPAWINIFYLTERPTDSNGKPTTDLTITDVTIRRVSQDAVLFNENDLDWKLPEVGVTVPRIVREDNTHFLRFSSAPGSSGIYSGSTDLTTWTAPISVYQSSDNPELGVDLTSLMAISPTLFFRGSSVYYPTTPAADRALPNAYYTCIFTSLTIGQHIYQFHFNSAGDGGTWCDVNPADPFECLAGGNLSLVEFKIEGPYTSSLFVSGDNGLPDLFFRFHHDRDTLTGQALAQSRLEGSQWEDHSSGFFRVAIDGSSFLPTANNVWQYIPAP